MAGRVQTSSPTVLVATVWEEQKCKIVQKLWARCESKMDNKVYYITICLTGANRQYHLNHL